MRRRTITSVTRVWLIPPAGPTLLTSAVLTAKLGVSLGCKGAFVSDVHESDTEPEADRPVDALELADFLADLRVQLGTAEERAEGSSLRLSVDEVTISLDVAVTTGRKGGGSGKVSAKFWVMNAELGGTGEFSSQRVRTQHLTLTLKPRIEQVTYDAEGQVQQVTTRKLEVAGTLDEDEEAPQVHGGLDGPLT
jgi:hypothetical protein